jgi:hypothetical protein
VKLPQILIELAEVVEDKGGRLYAVGGWVRDQLLGISSKDVDCEIHGLQAGQVEALLKVRGQVNFVGRAFGVFKLSSREGIFDIALPRVDLSADAARPEPHLGLLRACERRDFRCNALLYDPLTDEIIDLVEGRADIQNKQLRVVDPTRFGEDPLRALRAMRFSASLGFSPDDVLVDLCRGMDLSAEPVERVWGELKRTLLSAEPGRGLQALVDFQKLDSVLPELETIGVPALAAALRRAVVYRDKLSDQSGAIVVMLAVLLQTVPPAQRSALLARFKIIRPGGVPVRKITLALAGRLPLNTPPTDSVLRHLSELAPMAWILAVASALEPQLNHGNLEKKCEDLGLMGGPLPSLLKGQDLQDAGISPGPEMGKTILALRKVQLDGVLSSRDQALNWLTAYVASSSKVR